MKRLIVGLMALLYAVGAQAVDIKQLTVEEQAATGADLVMIIRDEDLTTTATNTAQTVSNFTVVAYEMVYVVAAHVTEAFVDNDASSPAFDTLTVTVGDGGDVDRFLTSMEVCSDGTIVKLKAGTATKLQYTTADTVDVIFTPDNNYGVAALDAGELKIYLKKWEP